ncbi:Nucleotidyltransferase [Zopfia rhizophila CBS 207.26]|uniref:DNA-directed DNA polymerase n=1 Tax=Zopfia rhizophila CBS 207.26 TaxID=1314779 RepID=A0A6A6DSS3_9PEZI|nr:Nucleotidyltransferase [Zopfia rhizophila CBS 207.26]
MDNEIPSSQTLPAESPSPKPNSLQPDFRTVPPILILSAHFKGSEEHEFEETLRRHGASLTSDVSKAKVFIGKVGTKRRAEFELRCRKVRVEEIVEKNGGPSPAKGDGPPRKRRRVEGISGIPITLHNVSTTEEEPDEETVDEDETEDESPSAKQTTPLTSPAKYEKRTAISRPIFDNQTKDDVIWVIKLDWVNDCVAEGRLLPVGEHLVYKGKALDRPTSPKPARKSIESIFHHPTPKITPVSRTALATRPDTSQNILERARADVSRNQSTSNHRSYRPSGHGGSRRFGGRTFSSTAQQAGQASSQLAHLLQQTTSEYEGSDSEIPDPPAWVKMGIKYACQRFTPANGPNEDFIEQLKQIRKARVLIDDNVGVRAYSTSIAAIAAYPYKIIHPREIFRLAGCENKIASLWVEWKNTGKIQAVEDFENDESMKILRLFYEIWGVGAKTARQFYYQNHWTELDDIIEFGWNDLDRVQQIGVKYYDEFLKLIPRAEVEQIAAIVREHAVRVRDERISVTLVGGYRRGKAASGDVDMIVSHPDLEATADMVKDIVESLEEAEWITHTLTMSLHSTHRGQATLPFRTTKASGAGFDTLDKALVVWQDPNWSSREANLKENPNAKNPNIHRRVDIIVSPWRTVGCAVMGWSGGTTFQRDLRRYAKHVKGWKFDSSGIRSRSTGEVVQLEGPVGVDGTPEDAERKVFEGLGLEYIPPDQRVTN